MDALRHAILDFAKKLEKDPNYTHLFDFTPLQEANNLILTNPNAFFYGAIADQQIKAERAWELPYHLQQRLGHLSPHRISRITIDSLHEILFSPPSLHRHPFRMAGYLVESSKHLCNQYGGQADRIWSDRPTATQLQTRLCQFNGINQKISSMILGLLTSHFQVPIRNLQDSEIAVDRHVRRVLFRSGVTDGSLNHTIEAGKDLHGENPARIDFALFWLGKIFCHIKEPNCFFCPLTSVCQKRIKPNLVAGVSEIQKTQRVVERAAQKQIRFLERLERSVNRLSLRETRQGKLHQMCAYHGINCPDKGKKYHPIRYLLCSEGRTIHVRKADIARVMKQVSEGKREQSLHKALKACQSLRKVAVESQKLLAGGN